MALKEVKPFVLENTGKSIVSGRSIADAYETIDAYGGPAVGFSFNAEGSAEFGRLTGDNVQRALAIVLDGEILLVATIQSRITGQGQLTGKYTQDEVRALVAILKGGKLPAPLIPAGSLKD